MPASSLLARATNVVSHLREKSAGYWVRLLITVVIVQSLVTWADNNGWITGYRYSFHRFLQTTKPHKDVDQYTVVVTIDDDDYWLGELAGRSPVKRDYLACLVEKLDAAGAKVIALDFDLRSPDPGGHPVESPDYMGERGEFLRKVKEVRHSVVLPRTIYWDENGDYVANSDIYDGYDFGSANVLKGYIALQSNHLEIPLSLKLKGDVFLDSFSMAVVRAFRPKALENLPQANRALYASFIKEDGFDHKTAREVLNAKQNVLERDIGGRIVIVGAAWSKFAYGVGRRIDLHETPMGLMPGAYVHANYVEAMLGPGTYPPYGGRLVETIEWLVVVAMALGFATAETPGWKVGVVFGSWVFLGLFAYFSFINLGHVFDLFVPAISVTVHWVFEHFWEGFQGKAVKP